MSTSFGARLAEAFDARGQLCVGIDPHPFLLEDWGLQNTPAGLREFALKVVDAAAAQVAIVKPQVAFFERHGAAGYLVLEEVITSARAAGLLVIADVKRGDVGSTVEAYAQAWLAPGSSLEVDAMTVSAYQGVDSLGAPIALAHAEGKGLFVLAATSNPESFELQRSIVQSGPTAGATVAASIVEEVATINERDRLGQLGSIGLVLGATVNLDSYGIALERLCGAVATPVLAPGFGHQGASFEQLGTRFGPAAAHVVVSASRSILSAGPGGIAAAVRSQAAEVARWRG
ncbi:orotidine-5'-phosphate decarboxylase [Parafrigoribacterium soli]|uniref:orotidine-5'-phosphate decarboxylase n=1 Tax=Parafrigoribacterium soli TaxID=3144663 RepID=UPI0032EDE104